MELKDSSRRSLTILGYDFETSVQPAGPDMCGTACRVKGSQRIKLPPIYRIQAWCNEQSPENLGGQTTASILHGHLEDHINAVITELCDYYEMRMACKDRHDIQMIMERIAALMPIVGFEGMHCVVAAVERRMQERSIQTPVDSRLIRSEI